MRRSSVEEDGSYWYELSRKDIKELVMKKYSRLIKKSERAEISDDSVVAIMVSPRARVKTDE